MKEFPEAFWVVIGTAAPITTLANAVALSGAMRSAAAARRRFATLEKQRTGKYPGTEQQFEVFRSFKVAFLLAGIGAFFNVVAMIAALFALLHQHIADDWTNFSLGATVASLALVVVQALVSSRAEIFTSRPIPE